MRENESILPLSKPIARLSSWIIWAFASVFLLYQFLLQTASSVMIPDLEQAFHINAVKVGLLSSSFFYPYFLLQVPAGMLVDRFGARRILAIGMFICAIAVLLFTHAQTFWLAGVSRMLMGLVAAPAFAAALYVAANWFSPRRFAMVAGLTEGLAMMGGMLGEVYIGMRVSHLGWQATLYECAIIGIIAAVLVALIVRDHPRDKPNISHNLESYSIKLHLRKVICLPQVWLIGLFSGCTFALVSALAGLWCVPYLQARYGVSVTNAAVASSMIFIGVAIGSPFLGWLSDRIGKRKPVMFYSTILCLLFLCLALYLPHVSFDWMYILLLGVGATASVYMLPFALIREITPRETRGTAMGFANMMSIFIGSPILQPLIGKFLELDWDHKNINGVQIFHVTDYQISLSILPICLTIALIILFFIRETHCQECN